MRTRLTAGLVILLAAACLTLGVVTTVALQRFLMDRLDDQLVAAGQRYVSELEHPSDMDGDEQLATAPGQAARTLGVRTKGGTVQQAAVVDGSTDQTLALTGSNEKVLLSLPSDGVIRTVALQELGEYRVRAVPGNDGDVLITGLPTDPVTDTVGRVALIEAIGFGVVLVTSGIAAAYFVRRSLQPLRRIAAAALEVTRLPLASGGVMLPGPVQDADPRTEVGQVGTAFNHMLDHVERSLVTREATEDRLRQFLANASHELRTPLQAIQGNIELARRSRDDDPELVDRSLDRVEAESRRMARLVDDLLLLARVDSGDVLMHEEVDLSRTVLDVVGDQQLVARDHTWVLELPEEPVVVMGDGHRLHQVVANLAANARIHTPPGTTITTRLERRVGDGGRSVVVLTVTDDGPGIPGALEESVFERFARGATVHNGGAGLGLAIVAAVVHAHGGVVTVASRPGDTTFTVTLDGSPGRGAPTP